MQDALVRLAVYTGGLASLMILFPIVGVEPLEQEVARVSREIQSATTFFVQSITVSEILIDYQNAKIAGSSTTTSSYSSKAARAARRKAPSAEKVSILIVPGHEPGMGGTEFGGLYERDIAIDISDSLVDLLKQNPRYDVIVARTKTEWNPLLQSYFDTHAAEIAAFIESQKQQMAGYIATGRFTLESDQVSHPSAAALKIYGINKWTSENNVAITLHLHVNDYGGRRSRRSGIYDGFVVYVPDHQYSNGEASKAIGMAIANRLSAYHATSTLSKEDVGVVEDRELIATGSNNTADGAALLIEYGYIYEPQFQKSRVREVAIADYAYATYLGLQDFFNDPVAPTYGSISFPYDWDTVTVADGATGPGVYALQSALRYLGSYPPRGKTFSDCPVSGVAGKCTQKAIAEYQAAGGLETTGTFGPKTRAALEKDLPTP